ncbi:MAG: hypothetical protein EHM13_09905, partial [Acidobacteria bacterium]
MTLRTFTKTVTAVVTPPPSGSGVAADIAALLAPGQWSSQLSTAQYLGRTNSPTILERLDWTGGDANPAGMPAFYAVNDSGGTVTLLVYTGRSQYVPEGGGRVYYIAGTTGW